MSSGEDHWQHVAQHSAADYFDRNPGAPEIAIQTGQSVVCVTFNLPDSHSDLFGWICNRLRDRGVHHVAHAVHPPACEESARRAYALLLDPDGEDWDWIEFVVSYAVLTAEDGVATGDLRPGNSGRKRARRARKFRGRVCVRSLIRQARNESAAFVLAW